MCGIVAVKNFDGQPVDPALLERMRDAMEHRGPDDAGLYRDRNIGLGHRRLSIVDLSPAGHQPLCNEDGRVWMVFNGEIYNYVELTEELKQRGHRFSSQSDGEVILHLYEEVGERCVERLNGMFTFVIWDQQRERLFMARDRLGIKPLHFYHDERQFICASEAKAILADGRVSCGPDRRAIADYLFNGFPLGDRTFFSGIRQLLPGHHLTVDGTEIRVRKYWDIQYRYDRHRSDARVIENLRELVDDAVRIHCRSDAPVGCHLSGGLDSSTVTSFAARYRDPLDTFSIRFDEHSYYDETAYARAAAAHVGATYRETTPAPSEFAALLPSLLWHMEMPLPNAGGFSYYTVSQLAAQHVKVSLTGHGGDEVFAGYPAQFRTAFGDVTAFTPGAAPELGTSPGVVARARRLLRAQGLTGVARRLRKRVTPRDNSLGALWMSLHCDRPPQDDPLLHSDFRRTLAGYDPSGAYLADFRDAPTDEVLDRCLHHDLRTYLPGLLYMEDRVSMAVSLESRVPLLDYRIIELMATIPPEQKVRGMQPKRLLREVGRGVVSDVVLRRSDKRGFPVPLAEWFASHLKSFAEEILTEPQSVERGIFNADFLRRREWTPGEAWPLVNVELWHRIFVDRDPVWTARTSAIRESRLQLQER